MHDGSRMRWVNPIVLLGAAILLSDVIMVAVSLRVDRPTNEAKASTMDESEAERAEPEIATQPRGTAPRHARGAPTLTQPHGPAAGKVPALRVETEPANLGPPLTEPILPAAPALSERIADNTHLLANAFDQRAKHAQQEAARAEQEGRSADAARIRDDTERAKQESERIHRVAEGDSPAGSANPPGADDPGRAPTSPDDARTGPGSSGDPSPPAAP